MAIFVFDAYGTLFDVHAAIARFRAEAGPDADRMSEIWRQICNSSFLTIVEFQVVHIVSLSEIDADMENARKITISTIKYKGGHQSDGKK